MMDLAEKHGFGLTMFLDLCEQRLYGKNIVEVGRVIVKRGHDLELHAHPGTLRGNICNSSVDNPPEDLLQITSSQAGCLADFLLSTYCEMVDAEPVGFRGGGYRYNQNLLDALVERGVVFDSSYNAGRPANQPGLLGVRKQFRWDNGILEIPISCVEHFKGTNRTVELNFNTAHLPSVEDMFYFLDEFYLSLGEDALAMLVMHSWSLLFPFNPQTGHFDEVSPENIHRLGEFFARLTERYEVVTLRDLHQRADLHAIFSESAQLGTLTPDRNAESAAKSSRGAASGSEAG